MEYTIDSIRDKAQIIIANKEFSRKEKESKVTNLYKNYWENFLVKQAHQVASKKLGKEIFSETNSPFKLKNEAYSEIFLGYITKSINDYRIEINAISELDLRLRAKKEKEPIKTQPKKPKTVIEDEKTQQTMEITDYFLKKLEKLKAHSSNFLLASTAKNEKAKLVYEELLMLPVPKQEKEKEEDAISL